MGRSRRTTDERGNRMIDLTELRRIATSAVDGPWRWDRLELKSPGGYTVITLRDGFCSGSDTDHIAAFSPSTALALLDEVERLRAAVVELADIATPYVIANLGIKNSTITCAHIAALRAVGGGK